MNLHDHTSGGDLLFAGELTDVQFRLLDLSLYNNDDDEKPDVPEGDVHGNWIRAKTDNTKEAYISAPGELIEELQRLEADQGDVFKVTRCDKSGPNQTDPYEVNLNRLEADQSRL